MRLLRYLPRYHRKYRHFGRLVTDGGGSERMVPIGAVADEFNPSLRATHHRRLGCSRRCRTTINSFSSIAMRLISCPSFRPRMS